MRQRKKTGMVPALLVILLIAVNLILGALIFENDEPRFEVGLNEVPVGIDTKQAVQTVTVTPQEDAKPVSPVIVTSYRFTGSRLDYVQLYNYDADIVNLYDWHIIYTISTSDGPRELTIGLTGYLPKKQYAVFAASPKDVVSADAIYQLAVDLPIDSKIIKIDVQPINEPQAFQYDTHKMIFDSNGRYDFNGRSASTGGPLKASKYEKVSDETQLLGFGLYDFDEDTNLRITEILATTRDCSITETKTNDCFEYVELYNPSKNDIDLSAYRLRIGWMNDASISVNNRIALKGILKSGERLPIDRNDEANQLAITASSGSIWLEDTYGLHDYVETLVQYTGLDEESHKAQAWGLDDVGIWKWAKPTPGTENDFNLPEAKPAACGLDEYRSSETGRCRKIVTASVPAPCKEGQYRSEETGRCRSIAAAAASVLKPCDDDEFRNPATGRCKKIASTEDILEPCKEGFERNPETNRCRKISATTMPLAEFPVQPIASSGEADPTLMWVGSSVVALAAGYGIWEWRKEIISLPKKLFSRFARTK